MTQQTLKIRNPSWWNQRPRAEKCLFVVVAILIILSVILLCFQTGLNQSQEKTAVCLTATCVKIANSILEKIDLDVDPCEDFYSFACGNFIKNTAIPEDKSIISSFTIVNDVVVEQMKTVFAKPITNQDIRSFILAKSLYQSCMDVEDIEKNSRNYMQKWIDKAGGWPVIKGHQWDENNFDWISTSYQFMENGFDTSMILKFDMLAHTTNSSRNALFLDQVDFDFLDQMKRNGFNDTTFQHYYKYMVKVAKVFGADNDTVAEEMKDVANFINELARITLPKEERRDFTLENNPMTIETLNEEFSYVPWLPYINKMLFPYNSVTLNDIIIVKVPSYYKKLETLLKNTPKRTLANYMFWSEVEYRISNLDNELRDLELEFYKAVLGVATREPRWKECTREVITLFAASGALYVRNYVKPEVKQNVIEMINYIQAQFIQNLKNVDWMDVETKNLALEKANNIYLHMAYPDELRDDEKLNTFYKNLSLSTTNYLENKLNMSIFKANVEYPQLDQFLDKKDWRNHAYVALVSAYYNARENSIEFLSAILQNVFFDVVRPKYLNYGAIGHVIGHEITHGFDDEGRQYDKHGNVAEWWEAKTKEAFDKRTQCIVDQYSNITVPEINMNLNGINTQGENIADNAGIKLAYLAYKEWSKKHDSELSLPGLMYTPDQMFWISVANTWCEVRRDEALKTYVLEDVHAPGRYRVNVPLGNSEHFANDFGCKVGSKMNSQRKCHVW